MDRGSFIINRGDRVGVVGPNGAGKSTLFKLICDEFGPDGGSIQLPKHCRLGHLRQELGLASRSLTLLEYTSLAIPEVEKINERVHAIERELQQAQDRDKQKLLNRLGQLMDRFEPGRL